MSQWTHIKGLIEVEPAGYTTAHKRYVLDTVLEHLPLVTGSERNMNTHIIPKKGSESWCSCDEFGYNTNNLTHHNEGLKVQESFIIVVNADLRDRTFDQTKKEFMKWMCRLSKRVLVTDVLVSIDSYREKFILDDYKSFHEMYEDFSSYKDGSGEPNWVEFMLWDRMKDSFIPIMLGYKYFNNPENDKEAERRIQYANN